MGIDFEFALYRGLHLRDEDLALVLRKRAPRTEFFRHAKHVGPELHAVTLYERNEEISLEGVDLPKLPSTASLFDVVQAARKAAGPLVAKLMEARPGGPPQSLLAAQGLSIVADDAFWLAMGDHSGVGGYARFAKERLVEPASPDEIYVYGGDYVAEPARRWKAASRQRQTPLKLYQRAFPDSAEPPIRLASTGEVLCDFDPREFEVLLG